ncbi:3-carboxy-cis,cis-muconate cycloisomerase [Jannaschia pohangensis]|uniref:3-carboxy-cis,cis-muconate cycloisomerase n=1 Tax=Jannaschia pohangensis TaxID=390807 RepID=A0A1I3IK39_9RHOB|nr:3-carboxy-cis,cis-muconate cycloisomerase [Jannaschia pohangensis]SFI48177.1 3-carboxy-cis,cis-muconate cycloisomerase [Jannaschia pohangensis]
MTNAFTRNGLFGDLLVDPELAEVFDAEQILGHMLDFEAAWSRSLADLGAIPDDIATRAIAVIEAARPDIAALGLGSEADGLPVPALVAALRAGQPADVAQAIHSGATSQDVIDSALALAGLATLERLEARIEGVVAMLDDLTDRFGDAPLMGRTRMQAALPITVGHRLGTWGAAMAGHLDRLSALRVEVGRVQVGGPVGLRDVPPDQGDAMAGMVARHLGLAEGPVWHNDRSGVVSLGHWLTLVAGTCGKIGTDLALMAQQGIGEVTLTGGGGSSAMPHKVNPVLAEVTVALARQVAAQQGALAQAVIHEQERSGVAWTLEWLILPAMAEATGTALRHTASLLRSIERIGTPEPRGQ